MGLQRSWFSDLQRLVRLPVIGGRALEVFFVADAYLDLLIWIWA